MPRQARLDIPGLVYHVMARGIERRDIFGDERDRERFVESLGELVAETGAQLYAWSLLSNHFHLLLRRGERPLADLMRRLMTRHAVRFNRRHHRTGHLFQNRYKSIVVEEEEYFLELVRYVHLNPVRCGVVQRPEELDRFAWSGHAVLLGARSEPWQAVDEVLGRFGGRRTQAKRAYRDFVMAGWNQGHREEFSGGGLMRSSGGGERAGGRGRREREAGDERVLGGGEFVEAIWREVGERHRPLPTRTWEEVLQEVANKWGVPVQRITGASRERRIASARREFLCRAVSEAGLSMAQLGRLCGINHTSVQRAVVKGLAEQRRDP
ncbi:MAG: transposase [Thermodesulfobacteriota bacterium]